MFSGLNGDTVIVKNTVHLTRTDWIYSCTITEHVFVYGTTQENNKKSNTCTYHFFAAAINWSGARTRAELVSAM